MPPFLIPCSLALALTLGAFAAGAQQMGADKVQVHEAFTAPTAAKQTSAEIYASFVNVETDDRLLGADSPLCERVELVAGDGAKRPFEEFRFKEDVETGFNPGALHLRLVGLKRPLVAGQSFPVTLHFEDGGALALDVAVH
jgi:periplasmic copper chaperone A